MSFRKKQNTVTKLGNKSIVISFYEVEHWLWEHNLHFMAKIIWRMIYILFSCSIPPTVEIADGVEIAHGIGIVIHQNSKIGEGTKIYQNVTIGSGTYGPKIGKNCLLGAGCCILGDITIGDHVRVGANAVVLHNIPSDSTVVGVPGKIVKNRTNNEDKKNENFTYYSNVSIKS